MQNVYFHEVEAAYRRRRAHEAAVASSLAAQAVWSGTQRRPRYPTLGQVLLRARDVLQRLQPEVHPIRA